MVFEATGSMHWFLNLMEELRIDCQVGHPAKIHTAETRKQKHDRRDAALLVEEVRQAREAPARMAGTHHRQADTAPVRPLELVLAPRRELLLALLFSCDIIITLQKKSSRPMLPAALSLSKLAAI